MEVKPGYKQTEIGVIPEDWDVKRSDLISTQITVRRPFDTEAYP